MLFSRLQFLSRQVDTVISPLLNSRGASHWLEPRQASQQDADSAKAKGGRRANHRDPLVCPPHSCMQCQRIVPVYSELAANVLNSGQLLDWLDWLLHYSITERLLLTTTNSGALERFSPLAAFPNLPSLY